MWIPPLCRHEQRAKALPPYGRQTIGEAEIAAVLQVLSSPLLTQGPAVPAFERAVAARVDARHGVAVKQRHQRIAHRLPGPGDGPGAWWSALNSPDHACGLSQLRPLLRRSCGFCGHRPQRRSDERGGGDRQARAGRARGHPAAPCRRWWCRCTWRAAAATWQRMVRWLSAMDLRCWRMPATRSAAATKASRWVTA